MRLWDWVVVQNRFEGSVHFSRDWSAYEHGFGDINNGEMWLGLRKIHELTYSGRYELHVIVENWAGQQGVAKYSEILVAGPSEKYELRSIGTFTGGNAGDGLDWHKNMQFSTMDADNDRSFENCAKIHHGGWWFNNCHSSNLNGLYRSGTYIDAIFWNKFGFDIKRTRMVIRVVYCEQEYEDGGWVVIQNRFDGSVNFERNWAEYEHGFGDMSGEHWLGLRAIHELTYSKQYKLHVLLELSNGTQLAAKYNEFSVAGSSELYQLKSLRGFIGDLSNEFGYQEGMMFSTFDADNDIYFGNCAKTQRGGWWYTNCGWSSLNVVYRDIYWWPIYDGIMKTRMMIKVNN